jgi:hypothetical protein
LKKCSSHLGGAKLETEPVVAQIERLGARGMRVLAVAQKIRGNTEMQNYSLPKRKMIFSLSGFWE